MRFPWTLTASMTGYIAGKRLRGSEKFPLVMMLEPLHACNLTCTGCGRIREYADTIREKLTVEQCLNALEECGELPRDGTPMPGDGPEPPPGRTG